MKASDAFLKDLGDIPLKGNYQVRLKTCGTYTQWNTTQQKEKLLPFTTAWMELESIMLSEVSQAVKDKYHMISP